VCDSSQLYFIVVGKYRTLSQKAGLCWRSSCGTIVYIL